MKTNHYLRASYPYLLALGVTAASSACVNTGSAPQEQVGSHVSEWRDEVIYQIIVDRFADGDESNDFSLDRTSMEHFHGGDWRGIEQHLDYIRALGVTTLWISPIVKNIESDSGIDSYHGYWTQDPFGLNPHFGNLDDLRSLINAAHAIDMKVVLDIVTNHMGQLFFYDINMNGRPDESVSGGIDTTGTQTLHLNEYDPDYQDPYVLSFTSLGTSGPAPIIFLDDPSINRVPPSDSRLANPANYHRHGRIVNYDTPCPPACPGGREQTLYGDFPGGLKDLATENPDVQNAMFEAYSKWIAAADFDGFRIDTVKHVDHDFWQNFAPRIRTFASSLGKDKFLLFGEAFDGDDTLVGSYTQSTNNGVTGALEMDTLVDFPQYYQVFQGVFVSGGATSAIQSRWQSRLTNWNTQPSGVGVPSTQLHVNFIDNHDVGRFRWQAQQAGRTDDVAALKNALVFQLTEDGIPCIYYGTEQGFYGGNDPSNREDLFPTDFDTSGVLFGWIASLNTIRRQNEAFRRGDMSFVWTTDHVAQEDDAGIVAYERTEATGPYALVIINTSMTHPGVPAFNGTTMKVTAPAGTVLKEVLNGLGTVTVASDQTLTLPGPLAPTSAAILLPQ